MTTPELESRARTYAERTGVALEARLGYGSDGTVWQTHRKTAIKVFEKAEVYRHELAVYVRLRDRRLRKIGDYSIPQLVRHDDPLMVIEMTLVNPPYVLDFGKVRLDTPPDYSPEVMADFFARQKELWGKYWPEIRKIWGMLKSVGIFHMDPKPGNILPENYEPELDE